MSRPDPEAGSGTAIESLSETSAGQRCVFGWGEVSFLELLLYNLRHVQHHAAQLNLILRQETDSAPGWVGQTKTGLGAPGTVPLQPRHLPADIP